MKNIVINETFKLAGKKQYSSIKSTVYGRMILLTAAGSGKGN